MKITANEIKQGHVLVIDNNLYTVSKPIEHTKPGKGGAYVQIELKNHKTKTKTHKRISSTDYVEKARIEASHYQFLYKDADKLIFMNNENYEQLELDKALLDNKENLLSENMEVKILFFNENPINIELPEHIKLEIIETNPHIKGSTATSSYKPAILEGGIKSSVPPYLETGDKIVIKSSDCSFVERAKS